MGPDLARKKIKLPGMPVVGRKKMQTCAFVAKQKRVEVTLWENVKCARRNGMCWRMR